MISIDKIKSEFISLGGIMKTSELNSIGLSSRQIKLLCDDQVISKLKFGYYELTDYLTPEEVVISRLFPNAVICLESALLHYGYTDRIPSAWQIAVDKNSEKSQYAIPYPSICPYYIEKKFLLLGIDTFEIEGVNIKIFDRERSICDVLRYKNKLEKEVFTNAIQRYIRDPKKNIRKLVEYAEILRVGKKVQTYIGVWL